MTGIVVKFVGGIACVLSGGKVFDCAVRKNMREDGLFVGDKVLVSGETEKVIEKLMPRKNLLIRPPIANVDVLYITVSPAPLPDLLLLDKLIVQAMVKDITPVLIINKSDRIREEFIKDLKEQYGAVLDIFVVSALNNGGIEELKKSMKNKVCVFAGQSAVGKSTLLNCLIPEAQAQTGDLSKKTERGRHTTRTNQIYVFDGIMLADTPGFTSLDMRDEIEASQLAGFYPEFNLGKEKCKYRNCNHIDTKKEECAVKCALGAQVSNGRYNRYKELYSKLKKQEEKRFG